MSSSREEKSFLCHLGPTILFTKLLDVQIRRNVRLLDSLSQFYETEVMKSKVKLYDLVIYVKFYGHSKPLM